MTTPTSTSSSTVFPTLINAIKRPPAWLGWGLFILLTVGGAYAIKQTLFASNERVYSAQVQALEVQNASRVGGRVTAILVEEGEAVKAGQPLVTFDDSELQSKLEDAKATLSEATARKALLQNKVTDNDIKVAQSQVEQAKQRLSLLHKNTNPVEVAVARNQSDEAKLKVQTLTKQYEQAQKSYEEGIISSQKLEDVRLSLTLAQNHYNSAQRKLNALLTPVPQEEIAIAQAKVRASQAELDKLREGVKASEVAIADAKIRSASSQIQALTSTQREVSVKAPMAGTVNLIAVTLGQLVSPDAPVVTILDENHLWVDSYLPESALPDVQAGQRIKVIAPVLKKQEFEGTIAFISTKSEFVPSSGGGSATSNTETSFRVKVNLNPQPVKSKGHPIRLTPGMTVNLYFPKMPTS
ncbi:MAG: HlyD family secretion protein [Vampirovibrionales bacterium]